MKPKSKTEYHHQTDQNHLDWQNLHFALAVMAFVELVALAAELAAVETGFDQAVVLVVIDYKIPANQTVNPASTFPWQ